MSFASRLTSSQISLLQTISSYSTDYFTGTCARSIPISGVDTCGTWGACPSSFHVYFFLNFRTPLKLFSNIKNVGSLEPSHIPQ